MDKDEIFEFLAKQRLNHAFDRFEQGEPLAVTKQRMDLAKGFTDNSEEGNSLRSIMMMNESEDPREMFYLFDDGYHTPADKQPQHESFTLNDEMEQAATMAMHPDQEPAPFFPNEIIRDQHLDIMSARKNGIAKRLMEEKYASDR